MCGISTLTECLTCFEQLHDLEYPEIIMMLIMLAESSIVRYRYFNFAKPPFAAKSHSSLQNRRIQRPQLLNKLQSDAQLLSSGRKSPQKRCCDVKTVGNHPPVHIKTYIVTSIQKAAQAGPCVYFLAAEIRTSGFTLPDLCIPGVDDLYLQYVRNLERPTAFIKPQWSHHPRRGEMYIFYVNMSV